MHVGIAHLFQLVRLMLKDAYPDSNDAFARVVAARRATVSGLATFICSYQTGLGVWGQTMKKSRPKSACQSAIQAFLYRFQSAIHP
jgi:hypothetical protein